MDVFIAVLFLLGAAVALRVIIDRHLQAKEPKYIAPRTRGLNETDILEKPKLPYFKRHAIVTDNEKAFFKTLLAVTQDNWHIFTKVRLEDIIGVQNGLERKEAYGYRSRIKSRHIDFVLCDKETLEILMCVELDDSSHRRKDRQERDAFVNQALADAGVDLVRIPARMSYPAEYVRGYIIDETEEPIAEPNITQEEPENPSEDDHRRFMPPSEKADSVRRSK